MGRFVDLDERVTAQFYDEECEEWTLQTVTIEDVLDSVCDDYTVLPSAQPERKKGRWNDIDAETYTWKIRCDQCGHERSMLSTGQMYPRFCENCGSDMRGDSNG